MAKIQKIEKVDEVVKRLSAAKSAAFIQYQGLTALDVSALRAKVKSVGGFIEVVKNTLITRALDKMGLDLPETLDRSHRYRLLRYRRSCPL